MKKVNALILRTAGTNCDIETEYAFNLAGAYAERIHVNRLMEKRSLLNKFHILVIPGGFSYGDDIASGKVLSNELICGIRPEILKFVSQGKLILGICNGFQVLVKMGLLPNTGASQKTPVEATLGINDSCKFEDRWVYLKRGEDKKSKCVWTKNMPEIIYIPVAHGEGKFMTLNKTVLKDINRNGQVAFRYVMPDGRKGGYPSNPNGSIDDIAGITDTTGRILGMMPHPERHITYMQNPLWRRRPDRIKETGQGLHIIKDGVNFVREMF